MKDAAGEVAEWPLEHVLFRRNSNHGHPFVRCSNISVNVAPIRERYISTYLARCGPQHSIIAQITEQWQ